MLFGKQLALCQRIKSEVQIEASADAKSNAHIMMVTVSESVVNQIGKGSIGYMHFLLFPQCFNPLPDIPTLGSSNSAVNKDMMSKI